MTDTTQSRRAFLGTLIGGVAAGAAVRSWPFRVFSFPAEIKPWEWRFAKSGYRVFPMEIWVTKDAAVPVHLGRVREMQIAQIEAELVKMWKEAKDITVNL